MLISHFSILGLKAVGISHSLSSQISVIQIHLLSQHVILNHLDPKFLVLMCSTICFLIFFPSLCSTTQSTQHWSANTAYIYMPRLYLGAPAFMSEFGKSILDFDHLLKLISYTFSCEQFPAEVMMKQIMLESQFYLMSSKLRIFFSRDWWHPL